MIKKQRVTSTPYSQPNTSLWDTLATVRAPHLDLPDVIPVEEMNIRLKELRLAGWEVRTSKLNCVIWWPNQSLRDRVWRYIKAGDKYKLKPLADAEYR